MRTLALVLVATLALSALAATNKASEMTKATEKAADAVDAALQVLFDLRQANFDAQDQKDAENVTNQANCDAEIADLFNIAEINKASGDVTTAHRKYIEKEIADSHAYIDWINSRRADISRREVELQDQRCYSAQIFVRSLKENDDAIEAIGLLRNDLFASIDRKTGGDSDDSEEELVQVGTATKKLAAYKHLMNEQALSAFNQLAALEDVEETETEVAPAGSVEDQINDLLDTLESHFEENIRAFEASEVKAGWDLAIWLQDSEAELEYFEKEETRTEEYIDKMTIALQAAKATENKAWEIYFQSSSNYHNAITICRHKGEDYLADKHQRDDEIGLLEEVIKQFKEQSGRLL
jgi:hypothetical protein